MYLPNFLLPKTDFSRSPHNQVFFPDSSFLKKAVLFSESLGQSGSVEQYVPLGAEIRSDPCEYANRLHAF